MATATGKRGFMRFLLIAFMFLAALPAAPPAIAQGRAEPEPATGFVPKPLVTAQQFMIVAAHPLAAEAGFAMLEAGGTAADAAIATLLALNVVEPQSSGIGGGAFAIVADGGGVTSWDGREQAPAGARPDMFLESGEPLPFFTAVASGHSVGVPGLVRMMAALHAEYGRLPWSDLFAPAIRLADEGFPVSPRLAGSVAAVADRLAESDAARIFMPGGVPLAEGTMLRQPALADTLRVIAREGPDAFYTGAIAERIVEAVARGKRPGTMTAADLTGYHAIERAAVCVPFAGVDVCGMGPPSSGATTVGQILMLLAQRDLAGLAADDPVLWHLFAEASRLAYADRAKYLADPAFVDVPVRGLLDPDYIAARARLTPADHASTKPAKAGDPPRRQGWLYAPGQARDLPGTTHLSVIDAEGLAISITASIETAFGSGRMAAGFLLNNELTDFSFRPMADGKPVANRVEPGKRPRSSMSPTIVLDDGRPVILTGSPGGSRIPEYVAQNLLAMLRLGLNPAEAAALPHVSQRNRGAVTVETGIAPEIAAGLAAMGHQVRESSMTSGTHTIRILQGGTLQGGADPRREGVALGR